MTVATRLRQHGNLLVPTALGSLALRVKSDALVLSDNDPVATWADSSGNSRDLAQGTAGNRPLYKTNIFGTKPAVRFDGTSDFLATAAFGAPLAQANTITLVCKLSAYTPSTGCSLYDGVSAGGRHNFFVWITGDHAMTAGTDLLGDVAFPLSTPLVLTVVFNGAGGRYRRNGLQRNAGQIGASSLDGITLGANYAAGGFASLDVAELVVYDNEPTAGELLAVERYLGAYYGFMVA